MTRKLQVGVIAPERDLDFLMSAIEWRAADALDAVTLVPLAVGSPASTLVLAGADAVIIGGSVDEDSDRGPILDVLATLGAVSPQEGSHTVLALALWGSAAAAFAEELAHPNAVLPPAGSESAPAPDELAERLRATAESVRPMSDAARYDLLAAVSALAAQDAARAAAAGSDLEAARAEAADWRDRAVRLERRLEDIQAAAHKSGDEAWRRASSAETAVAELRERAEELASQLYREADRADAAEAAKRAADARVAELFAAEDELERARDEARARLAESEARAAELEARAAALEARVAEAEDWAREVDRAREDLEPRASDAEEALRSAVARLADAEARLEELRTFAAEAEARIEDLQFRLAGAEHGVAAAEARATRAEAALGDAEHRASSAAERLEALEADRADLEDMVDSLRAELKGRRDAAAEPRGGADDREGRRVELEQRVRRADAERAALEARLRELERERGTAAALRRHFDAEREAFRARERRLIALIEEARGAAPAEAAEAHAADVAGGAAPPAAAPGATERVTSMLSGLSHELRSALGAVVGFTSLLLEGGAAESGRDLLTRIDRNSRAVLHVFNNVLDLAKLEEGGAESYAEPVPLEEAVRAACGSAAAVVGGSPRVRIEIGADAGTIVADRARLQQALANMIAAVARRAGSVAVEARGDGERVVVSVVGDGDSQTGAPGEATPGDALGVVAARRLAEGIGGTLEEVAGGLRVELPRSGVPAREDDGDAAEQLAAGAVLVLAGDPNESFLIEKYLREAGRGAVAARSAKSAMALAGTARPSAAVVDADDPAGLSLVRVLAGEGASVVAFGSGEWREEALRAGARGFLSRPIDRAALLRALEGAPAARPRVLVVDDEADARDLIAGALERSGFDVLPAAGGREALDLLARERPDLIVLDLMMPGMDGFEVAYRLNSSPDWRTIPVLCVTAKDLRPEERRALGSSVVGIVQKGGFGGREIASEVGRILANAAGHAAGT